MVVVELPGSYRGRFIAYRLERGRVTVIDSDVEFEKLVEKIRARGLDPRYILVDYVPEEEIVYLL